MVHFQNIFSVKCMSQCTVSTFRTIYPYSCCFRYMLSEVLSYNAQDTWANLASVFHYVTSMLFEKLYISLSD